MNNLNLPNLITILRILLIPYFTYLFVTGNYRLALIIFVITGLTDLVDGAIARTFHQRTKLGTMLDPAADKALMLVTFLVLSYRGIVPWWFTILVIARDLWIVSGVFFLKQKKDLLYVRPTKLSKLNTFFQLLTIFFAFSYTLATMEPQTPLREYQALLQELLKWSIYFTTGMTVISGMQYTRIGWRVLKGGKDYANLSVKENQTDRQ